MTVWSQLQRLAIRLCRKKRADGVACTAAPHDKAAGLSLSPQPRHQRASVSPRFVRALQVEAQAPQGAFPAPPCFHLPVKATKVVQIRHGPYVSVQAHADSGQGADRAGGGRDCVFAEPHVGIIQRPLRAVQDAVLGDMPMSYQFRGKLLTRSNGSIDTPAI